MTQEWPPEKISKIRRNIKAGYVDGKMTEKQQLSALDEIERLQTENTTLREQARWIPVEERLPEPNKRIEFFGGFEQTTHIGYYREHATQWESENGGFWHGRNFGLITHWRELPLPPERGK